MQTSWLTLLRRSRQRQAGLTSSDERPLAPRGSDCGPLPLSFAQERLWFLDRLETTGAAYNIAHALNLCGRLHTDALQATLDGLFRRHESLRTRGND